MKRQSIIKNTSDLLHERVLQDKLHAMFMDGTKRLKGISGNTIHILNPGRLNPYPGPDFLDMAIMINGELHIGNGEFHKYASDWFAHKHHVDHRYDKLLIHIICMHDIEYAIGKESIVISYDDILAIPDRPKTPSLQSLDDLQDYAFRRLMRKCNEVQTMSHAISDPLQILSTHCMIFLRKRSHQRRRYHRQIEDMQGIIHMFMHSTMIHALLQGADIPHDIMNVNIQSRNGLPMHLFGELFINAFYPFLLMQSHAEREKHMAWYWSQRSFLRYQSLYRRFPDIPQNYMWQQQGILEFMRNEYSGGNVCGEHIPYYQDFHFLEE